MLAVGSHDWENRFEGRVWTYSLDDVWARHPIGLCRPDRRCRATLRRAPRDVRRDRRLGDDARLPRLRRRRRAARSVPHVAQHDDRSRRRRAHRAVRVQHPAALVGRAPLSGGARRGAARAGGEFPHDARRLCALEAHRAQGAGRRRRFGHVPDRCRDQTATTPSCCSDSTVSSPTPRPRSISRNSCPRCSSRASRGGADGRGRGAARPVRQAAPGILFCPPEGDAGTGMVATNAVAPRTGNVSAGTSIFAMVVLERPLERVHHELDLVATPAGDPVAMVHCNNGASELAAWAAMFGRFAAAAGAPVDSDAVVRRALPRGARRRGGCRRPARLQPPGGRADRRARRRPPPVRAHPRQPADARELHARAAVRSLRNAQPRDASARATKASPSTGCSRTAACSAPPASRSGSSRGALGAPVAVGETASEGGAWGIAVLASYAVARVRVRPGGYLNDRVFAGAEIDTVEPDPEDVAGFAAYLDRYRAGLAVERAAVEAL